ncbi:DUF4160 domain-containing protein [Martelella limonii]|uniref:DUF4160 domain-containing protein n=1 Tax=Martelella limonii TaxID=1647649 RepID=UPI001580E3A5|nr:DUF4160 domain-containing protein [Martelella limonii]
MPTLLIWHGCRFRFYALDRGEPPHVHVVKDDKSLKVWLETMAVARNIGYNDREIERIVSVISEHQAEWIGVWNDFFGV